jgi:hypothetical protein
MASINKHRTKHIIIMILFYDFAFLPDFSFSGRKREKKFLSTEENLALLCPGPDEKPKRESSHKLPFYES